MPTVGTARDYNQPRGEVPMFLSSWKCISFCAAILAVAVSPILAQAPVMPDCSGISDVLDPDGTDYTGHLTTVRVVSGLQRLTHVASPPDGPGGPDDADPLAGGKPQVYVVQGRARQGGVGRIGVGEVHG